MIVVDTNVLVHLVTGRGDEGQRAGRLFADEPEWAVPSVALSELRNVLVGFVRRGWVESMDAHAMYHDALAAVGDRVGAVSGDAVLDAALELDLTAYDAEFVVLAEALDSPLVTSDRAILEAIPDRARELPR